VKAFFVTGTDTGIGKTTVACALLAAARARGLRVLAMKPVETGCARDTDGPLWPADALALERAIRGGDLHRTVHIISAPRSRESPAPGSDPIPLDRPTMDSPSADRARSNPPSDWLDASGSHGARAAPRRSDSRPIERQAPDSPPAARPPSHRPGHIAWADASEPGAARADGPGARDGSRVPEPPPSRLEDPPGGDGARAATIPLSNVYRFAAPLAPSVAAELEGSALALAPILRAVDRLRSLAPDFFLVEGAGGLLVPLTDSLDMADLAAALAMPLIVVARDGLGTINHTLLTLAVAAARGLTVAAVVLSASTPGTSETDAARNALEIERRSGVPVAGRLPHLAGSSTAALIAAAEAHLDLSLVLGPQTRI